MEDLPRQMIECSINTKNTQGDSNNKTATIDSTFSFSVKL
jgi:hypothetical protein